MVIFVNNDSRCRINFETFVGNYPAFGSKIVSLGDYPNMNISCWVNRNAQVSGYDRRRFATRNEDCFSVTVGLSSALIYLVTES